MNKPTKFVFVGYQVTAAIYSAAFMIFLFREQLWGYGLTDDIQYSIWLNLCWLGLIAFIVTTGYHGLKGKEIE